MRDRIIIIGASGAVGSAIVRYLDVQEKYKLILAGRRPGPLEQLKQSLRSDSGILQLDVAQFNEPGLLNGAALVIMCVDIPDNSIPKACAEQRIKYMDISASQQVLRRLEETGPIAGANKVPMLFSVGLAPGLSNLLAKSVWNKLPDASALEIYVLLGLGEAHGDQAFQWTFENLHKVYYIQSGGLDKPVKSFTDPKTTDLLGKRKFYLFDFVDQHILKQLKGIHSVSTRLAFDNRFFTGLVGLLRIVGLTKSYRNKRVQSVMMHLLKKFRLGSDVYGIKVLARNDAGQTESAYLYGHNEGAITAAVASGMVPLLLQSNASGLLQSHELVKDLPGFLAQLNQADSKFTFRL
ncbi:MAG: hypothetical protein EOP54_05835 [Sphingobacteriales bacterium]|nr:MAG: hypothetical protein EOP54_05835 [Sphingobacteriales bacterium]